MKKILSTLVLSLVATVMLLAQAPQTFSYQTVVRGNNWQVIQNQNIGVQVVIVEDVANGSIVYTEEHTETTNDIGLINLAVGGGTVAQGLFSNIDWGNHSYFMKISVDVNGGSTYVVMGTTQLRSVPYALFAETSNNAGPQGIQGVAGNDGQGGVTTSGTNVTVTGIGTAVDPYVVNSIDNVDDADADATNELQNLSVSSTGDTLYLQNGGFVIIPGISVANIPPPPAPLAIGDTYQGGVIFYLDGFGGGLITATTNQSVGAPWGCYGTNISGADGVAVGTGSQNTIDIEAGCTTNGTAADICANLTLGGYSDWFLPSRSELNLMYQNIGQGNALGLGNVGGFANDFYWSSTENGTNTAWKQNFNFGNQYNDFKLVNYYVRAVRAF